MKLTLFSAEDWRCREGKGKGEVNPTACNAGTEMY
jgi:hypothetical protein